MRFYIAARFEKKEEVREIYRRLKERGDEISADWTLHKPIRPYKDNPKAASEYSAEDIEGSRNCDVFVLLSNEGDTGMHTELGAAISSYLERGKPRVYVIGEHSSYSLFFFHPSVNRRKSIDEVLEEIDKV